MIEYFNHLESPSSSEIPQDPLVWLEQLGGPTSIWLNGKDRSRTRAVVTLLHGNEPSGMLAVHRLIREEVTPVTNILIVLASVEAALLEPTFRYRSYPGERDMNRSFNPPFSDSAGRIAQQLLRLLERYQPEAVLDVHNTSGKSPSFAVSTEQSLPHETLAAMFTERLVITELRMGSLMEQTEPKMPVVTIECGGAQEQAAHDLAYAGLKQFMETQSLFEIEHGLDMDIYHDPVRLELEQDLRLAFAPQPVLGVDITMLDQVDQFNFTLVPPGTLLGWVKGPDVLEHLRVADARGNNRFEQFFELCGNRLQTNATQKLFMVTTRPDIALSDCLLYSAVESQHERVHLEPLGD